MDQLSPQPPTAAAAAERLREFEAVMRSHNRRLYRTARGILGDDAEAEEAVQEAYLRAFVGLDAHLGAASLTTWLTRIVVNEALGRLRRRRPAASLDAMTATAVQETMMANRFPPRDAATPEDAAARAELRRGLERAIDALPPEFRTVFMMRAVEQMSTDETAEALGIPPETVRSRYHRGRGRLRRALTRQLAAALPDAFAFDGARCDRIVAAVLAAAAADIPSPSQGA